MQCVGLTSHFDMKIDISGCIGTVTYGVLMSDTLP